MNATRIFTVAALGSVVAVSTFVGRFVRADEKETPTIKHIMLVAHKGEKGEGKEALCKLIVSGKGTHETAEQLQKLYKCLAGLTPPKGDEADWKTRTESLVKAADELAMGDKPSKEAIAGYKKALDCKGCHTQHKPA